MLDIIALAQGIPEKMEWDTDGAPLPSSGDRYAYLFLHLTQYAHTAKQGRGINQFNGDYSRALCQKTQFIDILSMFKKYIIVVFTSHY